MNELKVEFCKQKDDYKENLVLIAEISAETWKFGWN